MSQSHLVIDFPIKAPANAKALTAELPALMPDFARTQDDLGTVHFSRFFVEGDEKLLFLSDIDGDGDPHIERLVESARPVLDAIFKHADDGPTPGSDPHRVVKWLKQHVREPIDTYFAYEDASVQEIKAAARAAGFTGNTSQTPLLTYMAIKSRLQGFALTLAAQVHQGQRQGSLGLAWDAALLPLGALRAQPPGLLHDLRRRLRDVHPGLRRQDLVCVRCGVSARGRGAAHADREERRRVLSMGAEGQLSAHRVLQRLSGSRRARHPSPAGRLSRGTTGWQPIRVRLAREGWACLADCATEHSAIT